MNALSVLDRSPRLMESVSRVLNKRGDKFLFGGVERTAPIASNPSAATGVHTAVPHKYLYAYLTAAKSFLRYQEDVAVYVHDDGSLTAEDKQLIRRHIPGAKVIDRAWADSEFAKRVNDEFLSKVRGSYTSYLKLFDPTLVSTNERILIVDTDVLFLKEPAEIMKWTGSGGSSWYHRSGPWKKPNGHAPTPGEAVAAPAPQAPQKHIQQLVVESIPAINGALGTSYEFVHGFNSGLIGYDRGTIDYKRLKALLNHLFGLFGERIFRWGSEQTMHGLVLCGSGAQALPMDKYMVYTEVSSGQARAAHFVHFIGEFRYHQMLYPRLAREVIHQLNH